MGVSSYRELCTLVEGIKKQSVFSEILGRTKRISGFTLLQKNPTV